MRRKKKEEKERKYINIKVAFSGSNALMTSTSGENSKRRQTPFIICNTFNFTDLKLQSGVHLRYFHYLILKLTFHLSRRERKRG